MLERGTYLCLLPLYAAAAHSLQGLMFGYATDETEELMPLTVVLSHGLNRRIAMLRRDGGLPWARPDSKTQVCACVHACVCAYMRTYMCVYACCLYGCCVWTCLSVLGWVGGNVEKGRV